MWPQRQQAQDQHQVREVQLRMLHCPPWTLHWRSGRGNDDHDYDDDDNDDNDDNDDDDDDDDDLSNGEAKGISAFPGSDTSKQEQEVEPDIILSQQKRR